jgi:hypothetical protein
MTTGILVSQLPKNIQDKATKLDIDGDGALGANDLAHALDHIDSTEKTSMMLKRVVRTLCVMAILLVMSTFGSSIAAARMAKDVNVDPTTGFAIVKGGFEVMKTSDAIVWKNQNIAEASNEQLASLKELLINDGEMRYVVKGHARDPVNADVILLVEGGTLRYGDEGLIGATGDALTLIETHYNTDLKSADGRDGQRELFCGCSANGGTSTGSTWSF